MKIVVGDLVVGNLRGVQVESLVMGMRNKESLWVKPLNYFNQAVDVMFIKDIIKKKVMPEKVEFT